MTISNPGDAELLRRVSVRPRRRQIRPIRPPPVAAEARSGAPAQVHASCEEMVTSHSRSRVGERRPHPLLPRQSYGLRCSGPVRLLLLRLDLRSLCVWRPGSDASFPACLFSSDRFMATFGPASPYCCSDDGSRPTAAPTMAPPAACVAPARLPPPSVRGFAAASLPVGAISHANPTVHGRLVLCEVPSTPESPASSNLVLATPIHTASPVIAAGDGGHVTGPSYRMRAGELLAASGAFDALATDMDGVELAPQTPLVSKCSNGVSVEREAATCKGWQEVRLRHGPHRLVSPASASCLVTGHHVAKCRDPFRCSCCLGNGHRARECWNAWHPLSLLNNRSASSLSHLDTIIFIHLHVRPGLMPHTLPSKEIRRDSWASVVSSSAGSPAFVEVTLQPVFAAQAELLHSKLQGMASLQMVMAIQPLSDVVDSMHGWLLRAGELSPVAAEAPLPPMSPPLPKLVVDFEGDKNVDLCGCFSPRASGFLPCVGSSLTPHVLPDFEREATAEVVSPVLQIMRELQVLCGEPISPLSMEQLKLDSLQTLEVDLPCQASNSLPLGIMERGILDVVAIPSYVTIGQVMPVSGMTIEPLMLAPTSNSNALFAKELCDLLASVEVSRPGLGKSIACLLMEAPIRDK
ncbi:hypothetical protein VPH35_101084 [Triticum aestivum]